MVVNWWKTRNIVPISINYYVGKVDSGKNHVATTVLIVILELVSDKKDFEILVRDVDLKGTPPLKWRPYIQNHVSYQNLKVLFIWHQLYVLLSFRWYFILYFYCEFPGTNLFYGQEFCETFASCLKCLSLLFILPKGNEKPCYKIDIKDGFIWSQLKLSPKILDM